MQNIELCSIINETDASANSWLVLYKILCVLKDTTSGPGPWPLFGCSRFEHFPGRFHHIPLRRSSNARCVCQHFLWLQWRNCPSPRFGRLRCQEWTTAYVYLHQGTKLEWIFVHNFRNYSDKSKNSELGKNLGSHLEFREFRISVSHPSLDRFLLHFQA